MALGRSLSLADARVSREERRVDVRRVEVGRPPAVVVTVRERREKMDLERIMVMMMAVVGEVVGLGYYFIYWGGGNAIKLGCCCCVLRRRVTAVLVEGQKGYCNT